MDSWYNLRLNEWTFQRSQFYYQIAEDIKFKLHCYRIQYGCYENEHDHVLRELARKCAKQTYQSGGDMLEDIDTCPISKICIFIYHGLDTDGGEIFWNLTNYDTETPAEFVEQDEMENIFQHGNYDRFEVGVFGTDDTKIIAIAFID